MKTNRLIIDAHLDLAWNALAFDRDVTRSVSELRRGEATMTAANRGRNTVSLPALRRGGVGLCLATLLARALPAPRLRRPHQRRRTGPVLREDIDYANQSICSATARGQLAYYRLLEAQREITLIANRRALDALWTRWRTAKTSAARAKLPVGCILSMEGADPVLNDDDAAWWWGQGLRTLCLAHYGHSAYAMGTGGDGPLTARGQSLVTTLDRLGVILDLVHTADRALSQALDLFRGPVFVSHGNSRKLVPGDRQISDAQIKRIAQRGGVIGLVLDCWMLDPKWNQRKKGQNRVTLATVADHVDHVCQLTGSVAHAGIGSDLDGGFGSERSPSDLDTIADLQNFAGVLAKRGYSDADIDAVLHGNWLRFFRAALPR